MPKRSRASQRQTTASNTYRFFVESGAIHGRDVLIEDGELSHQIGTVLRLRAGERVVMLDNCGWQYIVALGEIERGRVAGTIERKELADGEPRTKITLYAALMRPERFEWVLQKGTELGVSAFVPLICERSTIADADALSDHKQERWRRIIREAAEQSRRGKLPRLAPAVLFPAACDQAAQRGTALLLWEGTGVPSLRTILRDPEAATAPRAGKIEDGGWKMEDAGSKRPSSILHSPSSILRAPLLCGTLQRPRRWLQRWRVRDRAAIWYDSCNIRPAHSTRRNRATRRHIGDPLRDGRP